MPARWEEISARKRQERDSKIPAEWRLASVDPARINVTDVPRESGILTAAELNITEDYEAKGIVAAVAKGTLKAEAVAIAFCKRAAIAQQVTNCLTEIFFEEAIERGRYLDSYMAEHGKPLGPLHGLPISLKDCFSLPGYASTVGISARADILATERSVLASLLLSAGAILYVKTTTPQGQHALETHSFLWGRTLNPVNTTLSVGGSTGGEAALLAMRGSVLGIGTDLGGSIRVPAACCGLYGFKPTSRRVPRQGSETIEIPGTFYAGVITVAGPLARTMGDFKWFFEVLENLQPWKFDPQVMPYTFRAPPKERLHIGLLPNDGLVTPLPPVLTMLDEAHRALTAAGHTIEVIDFPEFPAAYFTAVGVTGLSPTDGLFDLLESTGETLSPWLAQLALERRSLKPNGLAKHYSLTHAKEQHEIVFQKKLWERGEGKVPLDVILCPVGGHPTPKQDGWGDNDYTIVWNLADNPAASVPVRTVTKKDLGQEIETPSLGGLDDRNRMLWNPEGRNAFLGAPMSVQVVGRRGEDGALANAVEIIDQVLRSSARAQPAPQSPKI